MPKEKNKLKKTDQLDLANQIISDYDTRVKECLEHKIPHHSLKTTYPGQGFEITISDKDREKIDEIVDLQKQRKFVLKKMKVMPGVDIPAKREGILFQDDLDMFLSILFVIKVPHMSPETYEKFMQGEKEKKTKELQLIAASTV